MRQCIKLFYFWNGILHVSDGLSVHHQILLSACLTYACCCMYSLELLMTDGKTVRNM